jgi:hypothetical protein
VTLSSIDQRSTASQRCALDLDTGQTVEIPPQVLRMPAEGMLVWLEQNGVDAIARMSEEGDGLVGVGLMFWTWSPSGWAGTDAVDLREEMVRATYQPRRSLLFQQDQYQHVFPFKTREGAIGMLQLLAVDKTQRTVQFRYRIVQEEGGGDGKADNDLQSQQLAQSVKNLMRFGLLACIYADHHEDQYPMTVADVKDLAEKEHEDYQWIVDHVEYLGAGKNARDPNSGSTILAYDKTLLQAGKGTYVVFRDVHAEFVPPDQLPKYGIPVKPQ